LRARADELIIWRIIHSKFQAGAFSGDGAKEHGGRFNSKGKPLIYTSGSLSLAVLEMLVQTNSRERLKKHICIPVIVSTRLITEARLEDLPNGWDSLPYRRVSQEFGDSWIDSGKSLVLKVPSVVNRHEFNYLINPSHPNFGKMELGESISFPVDPRLV